MRRRPHPRNSSELARGEPLEQPSTMRRACAEAAQVTTAAMLAWGLGPGADETPERGFLQQLLTKQLDTVAALTVLPSSSS
mmetsp:Transcript_1016/g.3775  ORF Transcript_1016/g.3775 Transcript_1016/m.3775 type:complete len:81 (-) Transcript_1016:731-973(-)